VIPLNFRIQAKNDVSYFVAGPRVAGRRANVIKTEGQKADITKALVPAANR
jgi:hypothetical protein